jgi:uncharacterized membrane protein
MAEAIQISYDPDQVVAQLTAQLAEKTLAALKLESALNRMARQTQELREELDNLRSLLAENEDARADTDEPPVGEPDFR